MMNLKFALFAFLLAGSTFLFSSCGDDDNTEDRTLAENVTEDDRFSDLLIALQRTDLDATLGDETQTFTVFAPTNTAFANANIDVNTIDVDALRNVLLYHVVGGSAIASSSIQEGITAIGTANATAPGNNSVTLIVVNDGTTVTIGNGANLVEADINSSNGVIHAINTVLTPPTVVGLASQIPNFSSLVTALTDAPGDLVTVLSGAGPFTVFAPNNAAFDAAASVVSTLTPAQVGSVLTYHVVSGNVRSNEVPNAAVATVNGQDITLSTTGGVNVTDSAGNTVAVTNADIQGTNGVIHEIGSVLIPAL